MALSDDQLFELAEQVREKAYAPYSKFKVGAAVLDDAGGAHVGCNVENAAYPLGACAEATAIGAMVAAGGMRIKKIAIIGGADAIADCSPCGGCRQTIAEFSDEDTEILVKGADGAISRYDVAELLPKAFRLNPKV